MGDFAKVLRRTTVAAVVLAGLATTTPAAAMDDTERPSVPSSRVVVTQENGGINLTWGSSTDNVGVAGYGIWVNGGFFNESETASFQPVGLEPNRRYDVFVRAFDAAGNLGYRSGITSFTTPEELDTERPSVVSRGIRLEPNGRFINWGPAVDNRSVVKYVLFNADTREIFAETSDIRFELPRAVAEYRLFVKAEDAAGNQSYRSGIASISTAGDPDRPSIPGAIRVIRTARAIELSWAPSTDNVGVAGYRVYDAETREVVVEVRGTAASLFGAPSRSVYVKAFDAAGNESYRTGIRSYLGIL